MFTLSVLPIRMAVCQLPASDSFPIWARSGSFLAFVRTEDELSIVCDEQFVPAGVRAEKGWRVLKVVGPLDFSQTGILSALTGALAQAGITIFSISTYDTDYLMVKEHRLIDAASALQSAGHQVRGM